MKKKKKTKIKKTKKYKIWFVILVVPILLSVLPISSTALFNVNINNNYLSSISYTSNGLSYSQQTYTNDETSIQFTLSRNADKIAVTYNYGSITTEPITHINASFEVKNTENGTPVKRLSNETPVCAGYQLSGNTAEIVRYNLTITEYVNRYKYSIDSDVDIGIEQLTTVQFQFNIDSQSGTIDINYISITLTFGQSQEQITVDLSGIESQLDNINEQISNLSEDNNYVGIDNVARLSIYGVRNGPNNNPSMYNITDYTIDNGELTFDTLYTTYQELIKVDFQTIDIKTLQIELKSNMTLQDDSILRTTDDTYKPGIWYNSTRPSYNSTVHEMYYTGVNTPTQYLYYKFEDSDISYNNATSLWIRLNMKGVSVTHHIWDLKIKINDIVYQIKMSAQEAENAVSNYESEVNELEPDPIDIEAENSWLESKYQEYLDNIVEEYPQYNWFGVVIYDNAIIMVVIIFSIIMMGAGFILYGKK